MKAEQLKDRYYGSLAATYDEVRMHTPLWLREQEALRQILATLPGSSSIIDIPAGTGRCFPLYREFELKPTAVDASSEMLLHARAKADELEMDVPLIKSDIRSLSFPDRSFDAALCMRFLNWINAADVHASIKELCRVSKYTVVLGFRSYRPLSELDIFNMNSVTEHLLQLKRRFYQMRTRDEFIYHEPNLLQETFDRYGLQLRDKVPIKTKKRGFDYSIYVAQRTN